MRHPLKLMRKSQSSIFFVLSILLYILSYILCSTNAIALETDKKEKLYIVSDTGSYNYKTGIDIYEGHVKLDQGSTHLTADRLITKRNAQRKIEEAQAFGINETAHYWTKPNANDPIIHAHAKIMVFYPLALNLKLEDSVIVTQGENTFHGQLILYNSDNQTITVPASKNNRAILVYTPEK